MFLYHTLKLFDVIFVKILILTESISYVVYNFEHFDEIGD